MGHKPVKSLCQMTQEAQGILEQAFTKMNLSARGYDRILKVARTIADLDNAEKITHIHIAEAIHFRNNIQEFGLNHYFSTIHAFCFKIPQIHK